MAILKRLKPKLQELREPLEIKSFMNQRGILFEQWQAHANLGDDSTQEEVFKAYSHELEPFMQKHQYINWDVINVHKETPNIEAIRAKFLSEHTHSEEEIRFFVDGEGEFFFHLKESQEVFSLLCQRGDFISVPAGFTHWFDLAPGYFVKAIRIFKTQEGWVANYTQSGVEKDFIR